MAWQEDFNPVSASDIAALAADRPLLVGNHLLAGSQPIWSSDAGEYFDTDRSDASAPAWLAADRSAARQTFPSGVTDSTWWLVAPVAVEDEFDVVGIFGTNFAEISGGVDVTVQVADDDEFSINLETVATTTMEDPRAFLLCAARWTGTGYVRVRFDAGASFVPRVGEIWFGRRRQLRGDVRVGRELRSVASSIARSSAGAASQGARALAVGRRVLPMSLRLNENIDVAPDSLTLRHWWREAGYGSAPFLWCARPSTAVHETIIATTDAAALVIPRGAGNGDRTLDQVWTETAPFLETEL